jgi:hypothetical protein
MSHHLVERRKELKRRRKRRQKRLKQRDKNAAILKTASTAHLIIPEKTDTATPVIAKPVASPTISSCHPYESDWKKAQSITELIKLLPVGIKPRKIWPAMPEQLKEEISKRARHMAASRNFAAPAEWDGSLKEALLLMDRGRLPNGFRIFLGI